MSETSPDGLDTFVLFAARVLLSVPFLCGGIQNLFGYGDFAGYLASRGVPYTLLTAFVGHPFWTFDDPRLRQDMVFHFWKNLAIAGGLLAILVRFPRERRPAPC